MPKILILGDTHIHNHQAMGGPVIDGINSRCRDIVRSILTVAAREEPDAIVQLGDFFDVAKPPPAVIDLAMQMIRQTNVPWYILAGNHDVGTLGAPTAIRPLGHLPKVTIFEEPAMFMIGTLDCMAIPYCSLSAKEAVNKAMETGGVPAMFFAHYGLANDGHSGPDYIDLRPVGCYAFHGHEHTGYTDENQLSTNVGSFCELRFGSTELYGDTYSNWIVNIKPSPGQSSNIGDHTGPIFLTEGATPYSMQDILQITEARQATSVYLRVGPERVTFAQELKSLGVIQDYAVLRQTAVGSVEQYAADFEKTDPLTAIAQVIVDRLEVGAMDEDKAVRIMGLAKKELQL
jgi:predicted phosphodiesterase